MSFKEAILIDCTEPECEHQFRWNGFGIKPKRCMTCENKKKFAKQIEYAQNYQNKRREKIQKEQNKTNGRGVASIHSTYPKQRPIRKKAKPNQKIKEFPKNGGTGILNIEFKKPSKKRKKLPWDELPTNQLIQHVQQYIVNPYIRKRDQINFNDQCISCENENVEEAGHFYPISTCPGMRFHINNIHGQGHDCNNHKDGNIKDYHKGIIRRHGQKYLHQLHKDHANYQKGNTKLLRHEILEIAFTYKYLKKHKIWIYTPADFEEYRIIVN
ncbi:recombination protein NinG [Candidatus Pacearchaeota archaeon]|nr:recombination protein NinG [Candidatus Pacearchaeota archaeon]